MAEGPSWPRLAGKAADVAADVADRLADPARLAELTAASAGQAGQPDPWQPVSLTAGYPGVAVLHAALDRPDRAHAHLAAAATAVGPSSTTSVFHGYGALVAGTAVTAGYSGGYAGFLARGERWLATQVVAAVREQRRRWATGQDQIGGHRWADDRCWDTICGITGAGRILLAAVAAGREEHRPAVEELLSLLVELVHPSPAVSPHDPGAGSAERRSPGRPGWWIPPNAAGRHPPGGLDLGVAHGIGGPLILLSRSYAAGLAVTGQDQAIRRITGWLLAWRDPEHRWPGIVGVDADPAAGAAPTRSAWCYGAAGVAVGLLAAGTALRDDTLVDAAAAAVAAMDQQDPDSWQLWGPTLCHGYAGVLAVATRVAVATGHPAASRVAVTAAELTLAGYNHTTPWGFRHVHLWQPDGPVASDIAGLLVGAAGAAAALAEWAAATSPAAAASPAAADQRPRASLQPPSGAGATWAAPLLLD